MKSLTCYTSTDVLQDYHATGKTMPELDESQDWDLLEGREDGYYTVLRFSRKRINCDPNDIDINVSKPLLSS